MGEKTLAAISIISLILLVAGFIRMHASSEQLNGTKTMAFSLVLGIACILGLTLVPEDPVPALTAQGCAQGGGRLEIMGRIEGPDTAVCLMPDGVIKDVLNPASDKDITTADCLRDEGYVKVEDVLPGPGSSYCLMKNGTGKEIRFPDPL